jgi:hypothetical protein
LQAAEEQSFHLCQSPDILDGSGHNGFDESLGTSIKMRLPTQAMKEDPAHKNQCATSTS